MATAGIARARPDQRLANLVVEAIRAHRRLRELEARVHELKDRLRAAAVPIHESCGDDRVEFVSPSGVATIVFPEPRVVIRDGASPDPNGTSLSAAAFGALFETRVVVASGAAAEWAALRGRDRRAADRLLERLKETPRVLLPK